METEQNPPAEEAVVEVNPAAITADVISQDKIEEINLQEEPNPQEESKTLEASKSQGDFQPDDTDVAANEDAKSEKIEAIASGDNTKTQDESTQEVPPATEGAIKEKAEVPPEKVEKAKRPPEKAGKAPATTGKTEKAGKAEVPPAKSGKAEVHPAKAGKTKVPPASVVKGKATTYEPDNASQSTEKGMNKKGKPSSDSKSTPQNKMPDGETFETSAKAKPKDTDSKDGRKSRDKKKKKKGEPDSDEEVKLPDEIVVFEEPNVEDPTVEYTDPEHMEEKSTCMSDGVSIDTTMTIDTMSYTDASTLVGSEADFDDEGEDDGDGGSVKLTFSYVEKIERDKRRAERKRKHEIRQQLLRQENEDNLSDETKEKEKKESRRKRTILKSRSYIGSVDSDLEVFERKKRLFLQRAYDEKLLKELEEATSTSLISESSEEYVRPCTVSFKEDFLMNFDNLPTLSDISSEQDIELEEESVVADDVYETTVDFGKFVDPLTGLDIESTESVSATEADVPAEEEFDAAEEISTDVDDMLPDFGQDDPASYYYSGADKEDMADDFLALMDGADISVVDSMQTDYAVQKAEREARKIAIDFLFQLFNDVVDQVEYIDPKILLSQNLDKKKIMEELINSLDNLLWEKHVNASLNSKLVEYYKRAKSFRPITIVPEQEKKNIGRYYEALNKLDHQKNLASTAKKVNAYLMSSVLMDLQHIHNICQSTESDLNSTMKKYLVRKDSEFMTRLVDHEIRLMARLRNEVSDTRLVLITMKHTMARLDERIDKFETITDDLKMSEFLNIQTQVQKLDRKLEERNSDLRRLHSGYYKELHLLAHLREKGAIIEHTLKAVKLDYALKKNTQIKLREHLFRVKMEHTNIRKRTQELVHQGGLVSIPSLLLDYDIAEEKVLQKRIEVQKLKDGIAHINKRVSSIKK